MYIAKWIEKVSCCWRPCGKESFVRKSIGSKSDTRRLEVVLNVKQDLYVYIYENLELRENIFTTLWVLYCALFLEFHAYDASICVQREYFYFGFCICYIRSIRRRQCLLPGTVPFYILAKPLELLYSPVVIQIR